MDETTNGTPVLPTWERDVYQVHAGKTLFFECLYADEANARLRQFETKYGDRHVVVTVVRGECRDWRVTPRVEDPQ